MYRYIRIGTFTVMYVVYRCVSIVVPICMTRRKVLAAV